MKGICFTFDAFGQWSEHDRSKMKWRMKVGIKWRPSMAGWPPYTQKVEDLRAWGRSQKMKIQELQDQNATQEAIIKELQEHLEKTGQEIPK
jgi:hypothetical protein